MILCLIGPSGSGKTTLGNFLKTKGWDEIISHTTRKKRVGEKEGETYYYVSEKEFLNLKKVEEVTYAGNKYCVSEEEVLNKIKKNNLFIIVSVEGFNELKNYFPDLNIKSVYISAELETLIQRMEKRGSSKAEIKDRIKKFNEDERNQNLDIFDFHLISKTQENDQKVISNIIKTLTI